MLIEEILKQIHEHSFLQQKFVTLIESLHFSFPVRALSSGTKTSRAKKLHMRSEQCQPPKLNLKTHGPNVLLALV